MNDGSTTCSLFVGIDVSADTLDLARSDDGDRVQSFPNTADGVRQVVELLEPLAPARIAVEATGKLERPLLIGLLDAALNACCVNPQRVRQFALGMGWLAKTDHIDARLLARFAQHAGPRISQKKPEKQAELAELLVCRRQLVDARTAHGNQLRRTDADLARRSLNAVIGQLQKQIDTLEARIGQLIDQDDDMSRLNQILTSVKGVGPVLAATLIGQLTEIGRIDHNPLAALVGLAPFNHDSGKHKGQRAIRGGRAAVRNVLYVSTIAAIRCNPVIKATYRRLKAAGKKPKVAIIACSRKLLRILNALVRDNVTYNENHLAKA